MAKDVFYDFKKQETKTNGNYYFRKGFGKNEKPSYITPYQYGTLLEKKKKGKKK